MYNVFPYVCMYIYVCIRVCLCVCGCVCVCERALARVYIGQLWNRSNVKMKISVPDRRKKPHAVRETNIFTRLQLAGCDINHPRLLIFDIKRRV